VVWQSLVHYSLSTTPDTEAIPEDVAAAITPAAAAEAVYTIRQQRKEEHRRLAIATAELDTLRAQVGGRETTGCHVRCSPFLRRSTFSLVATDFGTRGHPRVTNLLFLSVENNAAGV